MTKYSQHLKPHWDTVGWFNTLLIRFSMTYDERERDAIADYLATMTDENPELRPYARNAGIPSILPDYHRAVYHNV